MEKSTVRSARETRRRAPAAEPGVRSSLAAALVDLSPRGQQLQSLGQAATAQLQIKTKSSAHGEKADGSASSLRDEVTATIDRNRAGELQDDIAALKKSIASRQAEQASFKEKSGDAYERHAARITLETDQLARLESAYAANKAARQKVTS